jgi:GT2 family glycosyltransferase
VGALRNRGAEAAVGEILALVDSDHEVPPGWLTAGAGELAGDPDLHMIGSAYLPPPDGTWVQRFWALHRLRQSRRAEVPWLASGNLFLRKADFDRIGGFDESLVAAEDVDLCVRMAAGQGRIVSDPKVANIHHGEPATLWQFCRKEFWRGSSGIRAFIAHGMPLHELPSLIYPLYHLLAVLGLALAGKTTVQTKKQLALPALAVLYFAYGLTRAVALFKL